MEIAGKNQHFTKVNALLLTFCFTANATLDDLAGVDWGSMLSSQSYELTKNVVLSVKSKLSAKHSPFASDTLREAS